LGRPIRGKALQDCICHPKKKSMTRTRLRPLKNRFSIFDELPKSPLKEDRAMHFVDHAYLACPTTKGKREAQSEGRQFRKDRKQKGSEMGKQILPPLRNPILVEENYSTERTSKPRYLCPSEFPLLKNNLYWGKGLNHQRKR